MGTGRLALPLAARGLAVTGVDASAAMLERLAAKPGAERLRLVVGDMADLDATDLDRPPRAVRSWYGPPYTGTVRVVLIAYNTLFNLADDAAQARCLAGVGRPPGAGRPGWWSRPSCPSIRPDPTTTPAAGPSGTTPCR